MKDIFDQIHADRQSGKTHALGKVVAIDAKSGHPIVERKDAAPTKSPTPEQPVGTKEPEAGRTQQAQASYDVGPLAGKSIPGMVEKGNIDVNHRPQIHNDDGSMSSIYSVTVPLDKDNELWPGKYEKAPKYALVPSIRNGKFLTPDGKIPQKDDQDANEAMEDKVHKYYDSAHEHLGIFNSEGAANKYANATHAWGNDGTDQKVYAPSYQGDSNLVINPGSQTAAPKGTPGDVLPPVSAAVPVPSGLQ